MTHARKCALASIISTVIVLASVGMVGCAQPEEIYQFANDGTSSSARIFVAFSPFASKTNGDAFRLIAYAPASELDPSSVVFCLNTVAVCNGSSSGSVVRINGVQQKVKNAAGTQEHTVFVSEKFIGFSPNMNVSVLAKDKSGVALTEELTVTNKGGGTTPSDNNRPDVSGSCIEADEFTCKVESEIVRLTNEKRRSAGKSADLVLDPKMSYVARLWSQEMAKRGSISHEWFSNGTWANKYREKFGTTSPARAENVAMSSQAGSDATATAKTLVDMWWNSAGHKANMMGDHAAIGVGWAKNGSSGSYGTQNFGDRSSP